MANISQEVNIEMLEKLADGSYKKKNPQTKASQVIAEDGSNLESHLAESATQAHLAKNIGLEDTVGNFASNNVEGAMTELFTNVSNGKQLVGTAITDVDNSVVIPTEPTFNDLSGAIGQISTGKKWASGHEENVTTLVTVTDLPFEPSLVILKHSAQDSSYMGNQVYMSFFISNKILGNKFDIHFYTDNYNMYYKKHTITSNGFSMNVHDGGISSYYWLAVE